MEIDSEESHRASSPEKAKSEVLLEANDGFSARLDNEDDTSNKFSPTEAMVVDVDEALDESPAKTIEVFLSDDFRNRIDPMDMRKLRSLGRG